MARMTVFVSSSASFMTLTMSRNIWVLIAFFRASTLSLRVRMPEFERLTTRPGYWVHILLFRVQLSIELLLGVCCHWRLSVILQRVLSYRDSKSQCFALLFYCTVPNVPKHSSWRSNFHGKLQPRAELKHLWGWLYMKSVIGTLRHKVQHHEQLCVCAQSVANRVQQKNFSHYVSVSSL